MDNVELEVRALALKGLITLALPLLLLFGGAACGLWLLMKPISLSGVRAWAIAVTLALPVVAFAGFLFGRREASVMTDGLRTGVNEVANMADRITEIKGKTASQLRQPPVTVQVATGALPAPRMYHKQIEGESERVDL